MNFKTIFENTLPYCYIHGCHYTWKTEKPWKNLDFDNLGNKKKLEKSWIREINKKKRINLKFWTKITIKPRIFTNFYKPSNKTSIVYKKSILCIILIHQKNFSLLKNIFKVSLQFLFYVFILFNTVNNSKFNFKLKLDAKMCIFKKPGKNLKKRVATLNILKISSLTSFKANFLYILKFFILFAVT